MPRRANGEGTITQRRDGRWEGRAYVLTPNGQRVRKTVYGRTRADVHAKVTALTHSTQHGIATAMGVPTVAAYLDRWLADAARRLRPSTRATYEVMVRKHITPIIGARKLDQLNAPDIRRLLHAKLDEGLSANTVRHIHAVLRSALEQAVRDDLLARNVARNVQAPHASPEPVVPFDVDEARRLLDAAADDRLFALWTVALAVGLRKGEALALRWSDVDLDQGQLRVARTVQRVDGALLFAEPKTARSRRTVVLPNVCIDALRSHRLRQNDERLAAGPYWQDNGLVFTTSHGTPIEPRNINRSFDALCRRAGLRRLRVHDLRHTCASLLLAQGVPARLVMEMLGHSQIGITMNLYSHVLPTAMSETANAIERALATVGGGTPDGSLPASQTPSEHGIGQ
ncbi:MAG: tyrosine-type recombinase/integrase [Desertimonas sp.]